MTTQVEQSDADRHNATEWLRVTLSCMGDAVITTDMLGNVAFVNRVAQSLCGWSQADAVGKPLDTVFQIVNELTRQPVESPSTRALRDGVIVGLANHTILISRDGTERHIDDNAAPIRSAAGEVAGVVLVFRDVTDRKQTEENLRAIEQRMRLAIEATSVGLWEWNIITDTIRWDPQMFRIYGVTPTENGLVSYSTWSEAVLAADLPSQETLLKETVQHRGHSTREFRILRKDTGERRTIQSVETVRTNSSGNAEWVVGTNLDITLHKRAEDALQVSEIRYRRLFETAKDGILILDFTTGEIVDANPFMSDLLGYSHSEFSGRELWEIGLFSDKSANEAAVRELQSHGYLRYEHLPLESKDGRRIEVEVVANAYQENSTSVIQFNIRDITDRSHLEKLLRGKASELSDLHRRKDEFLAMLSHELRSPLAPIANAVQLLGLRPDSETRVQQQARKIIERQLRQLQHLVDDLLEVSRITTGRVQLRRERVAVSNIVSGAVETVRPLITQRRHDLSIVVPTEPIWLFADAARLEQVLVNVLSNAAKYTDEGGHIWLTVEIDYTPLPRSPSGEQESRSEYLEDSESEVLPALPTDSHSTMPELAASASSGCVVIRIRDTGVGIDPALLPRIFDLFTQAERSLDRSQGGLGIGLALVQRLTELHGGTVEATSTLGQGTEFVIRLPLPIESSASALPVNGAELLTTHPLRVLVVDDNPDTVLSFSMLLEAHGRQVRTANDGLSAVRIACEFLPDMMLLDIGLPGLNGYEVAKRVRTNPKLQDTILVALTGYGQDTDRRTSLQAGFNHHLVKPAILEQLLKIVASVSGKST